MKLIQMIVRLVGFPALAVVAGLVLAAPAAPSPTADPVDDLRDALPVDDVTGPTEAMLQFRRVNLQKKVDALQEIGDLRRALVLDNWRDDPARGADVGIRRIDADMRREVARRLTEMLEIQARTGPVDSRVAVANLIAEMGPGIRGLTVHVKKPLPKKGDDKKPEERSGFARGLFPILQILINDKDAGVRREALRALGNINPDPKKAGPLFGVVLKRDPDTGARRVAADGLAQMVRVVNHLHSTSPFTRQVSATRAEVLDVLHECVQTSAIGFQDADAKVRQQAVAALVSAVQTLSELIAEPFVRTELPPVDRPLDDKETRDLAIHTQELVREVAELQPLLSALRADVDRLPPLLKDQDGATRLAALDALRHVAIVRQRLSQRVLSMPNYAAGGKANLALLAGADPLENFLQKDLSAIAVFFSDPDVQFRKNAALFLLHIEDGSLPLTHAVISALSDADRSIRWIAARTLAQAPPDKAAAAVPALARMLRDEDVVLRIAAANTLQALGPHARAAADALAHAVTVGDADGRLAALHALRALGVQSAPTALPKLMEVLGQPDADPRVLVEACSTVARYRADGRSAVPALRRLHGHDNSDVRMAASQAILAVNTTKK